MVSAATLQAKINRGYGIAGAKLGTTYTLYRSTGDAPLSGAPLLSLPVTFTSAKSGGFNFDKSSTFDDVLFAVLADANRLQIGDYLLGPGGTYFIADMPSLRPVVAVGCNATMTLLRPGDELSSAGGSAPALPSQPGSAGTVWGVSTASTTSEDGAGEVTIRSGIPISLIGTTGRATGTGELPSDAPGPSRWRAYLPRSAFPQGSVEDRDILTDDVGRRFQVSTAYWSTIGYRLEVVQLEN